MDIARAKMGMPIYFKDGDSGKTGNGLSWAYKCKNPGDNTFMEFSIEDWKVTEEEEREEDSVAQRYTASHKAKVVFACGDFRCRDPAQAQTMAIREGSYADLQQMLMDVAKAEDCDVDVVRDAVPVRFPKGLREAGAGAAPLKKLSGEKKTKKSADGADGEAETETTGGNGASNAHAQDEPKCADEPSAVLVANMMAAELAARPKTPPRPPPVRKPPGPRKDGGRALPSPTAPGTLGNPIPPPTGFNISLSPKAEEAKMEFKRASSGKNLDTGEDFDLSHLDALNAALTHTSLPPPPELIDDGATYLPSPTFDGCRPGFVFKAGNEGVGYYRDDGVSGNALLRQRSPSFLSRLSPSKLVRK